MPDSPTPSPWLDLTTPITDQMLHWPDNAPVHIRPTRSMAWGDAANVTELSLSAHTATHVDAPRHFLAEGADVTQLDLSTLMGPARVVRIEHEQFVTRDELERQLPEVQPGARLLFRTRNTERNWSVQPFTQDFVKVRADAAKWLRDNGVVCVGVDYLSVGPADTHKILLGASITVIEGLNLRQAEPGRYDIICLPLLIEGADGAPARIIARRLQE
ncbi:cyclase family protein [Hymenobacter sp. 15J16-1T3B]|uniref:cyclase family protein n=1 Tax=Hymenobacter sp. 15J16-1T3B TaxID=2886941 RepID=UPI001D106ED9|nr:cyclase family protein [Hymenobacter sp. 15J16-1T3B]MCC3160326.1 cyclase family protein [Hymenobacter sp. 15J16-1T3B]